MQQFTGNKYVKLKAQGFEGNTSNKDPPESSLRSRCVLQIGEIFESAIGLSRTHGPNGNLKIWQSGEGEFPDRNRADWPKPKPRPNKKTAEVRI